MSIGRRRVYILTSSTSRRQLQDVTCPVPVPRATIHPTERPCIQRMRTWRRFTDGRTLGVAAGVVVDAALLGARGQKVANPSQRPIQVDVAEFALERALHPRADGDDLA